MENTNLVEIYYHFIFPNLIEYRCGNCYKHLGENLELTEDSEIICPRCGYTNMNKHLPRKKSDIKEKYDKLIHEVEEEIAELEKKLVEHA